MWRPGFEVLANTGDDIPPRADGVPPERLNFGLFSHPVSTLTFRTQPEAVDVSANPAGSIPTEHTSFVGVLILQLVEQEEGVDLAVMNAVPR
ncbi:hypothetical protein FQZ97_1109570 [compost metagenome]